MGPFGIVVGDVLRHGPSDVLLATRHQPVETLLLDRPDETFGVRIRIRGPVGCLHDTQARSIIGDGLRARSAAGQGSEAVLACNVLNRMRDLGRPASYAIRL